jgi:hypothetical protein
MKIFLDEYTQTTHKYVIIDDVGKSYYILDTLEDRLIVDTLVVHAESYDEVEDSTLFKRLLTMRSRLAHYNHIVDIILAQKK